MEKNNENKNVAGESNVLSKEEDIITLLEAIFRHGDLNLSSDMLNKSVEERQETIKLICEQAKNAFKGRPTIVDWLQSGFYVNEDIHVPVALLFIEWFERHPSPQENECNFREIYHFLYKMIMNEPVLPLSPNSAKVLHTLLSEIIEEVWPNAQKEVIDYLSQTYNYRRPGLRRTYSRKK